MAEDRAKNYDQKRWDAMSRHPSKNCDDGGDSRDLEQGWSLVTRFNKFDEPIHYFFVNFSIHTIAIASQALSRHIPRATARAVDQSVCSW